MWQNRNFLKKGGSGGKSPLAPLTLLAPLCMTLKFGGLTSKPLRVMAPQSFCRPRNRGRRPPILTSIFFWGPLDPIYHVPEAQPPETKFAFVPPPCRRPRRPQIWSKIGRPQLPPYTKARSDRSTRSRVMSEKPFAHAQSNFFFFRSKALRMWAPVPGSTRHQVLSLP